ncbi:MAG: hypothetical protein HQK51_04210 [Oligoflexia bacterium]|nr:hypothetical protein [Oligoflexia bacterium]
MEKKCKLIFIAFILFGLLLPLIVSCSKNSTTAETAPTTSTSATESRLLTVENGLVPSSMTYSSSSDAYNNSGKREVKEGSVGPCTGYSFMGCQPVLLRLYMNTTKSFMRLTRMILNKVGTEMGTVADGASATETLADSSTLTYSKTDANNFSVLLKDANATPAMYLSLANGVVTLKTSFQYLPTTIRDNMGSDAPTTNEKIQVTLTYTDSDNWTIDSRVVGMACEASDTGAPSTIIIKVTKTNGVWNGKAMMYHPRWVGSGITCDTTPSNTTAACIYSDFVANNTAAKSNVYLLARNETVVNDTYIINRWCTNYLASLYNNNSSSCNGLFVNNSTGLGSSTDYVSPFCMDPSSGSPVATWNSTCSGVDATISSAAFGSSSDWILPSDIYSVNVTIPSTL